MKILTALLASAIFAGCQPPPDGQDQSQDQMEHCSSIDPYVTLYVKVWQGNSLLRCDPEHPLLLVLPDGRLAARDECLNASFEFTHVFRYEHAMDFGTVHGVNIVSTENRIVYPGQATVAIPSYCPGGRIWAYADVELGNLMPDINQ